VLRDDRAAAREFVAQAAEQRSYLGEPATLALVFADMPPPPDAVAARVAALRAEIARGNSWPSNFIEIAALAAATRDVDAAMAALDEAIAAGFRDRNFLQVTPLFRALRIVPHFMQALARIDMAVAKERALVEAADWLPPDLLSTPTR
jgi:hypothetical protein